jgi:hypothetical protein
MALTQTPTGAVWFAGHFRDKTFPFPKLFPSPLRPYPLIINDLQLSRTGTRIGKRG